MTTRWPRRGCGRWQALLRNSKEGGFDGDGEPVGVSIEADLDDRRPRLGCVRGKEHQCRAQSGPVELDGTKGVHQASGRIDTAAPEVFDVLDLCDRGGGIADVDGAVCSAGCQHDRGEALGQGVMDLTGESLALFSDTGGEVGAGEVITGGEQLVEEPLALGDFGGCTTYSDELLPRRLPPADRRSEHSMLGGRPAADEDRQFQLPWPRCGYRRGRASVVANVTNTAKATREVRRNPHRDKAQAAQRGEPQPQRRLLPARSGDPAGPVPSEERHSHEQLTGRDPVADDGADHAECRHRGEQHMLHDAQHVHRSILTGGRGIEVGHRS